MSVTAIALFWMLASPSSPAPIAAAPADQSVPAAELQMPAPEPATPAAPGDAAQADEPAAEPATDEIVVTARSRRGDPAQAVNLKAFAATEAVDQAVIGPIALAYRDALPKPVRRGLRNVLSNLREPVVALNFLLQLKPVRAGATLGRFAINSTIGAVGLFDIAKRRPFGLPRRPNGFGDTLGYYGVKPGAYLFLPLIGSTTVRDLIGVGVDQAVLPLTLIKPFSQPSFQLPTAVLAALDRRADQDDELARQRASTDPYSARRKFYLERRQAEIDALRGRAPVITPAEMPADERVVSGGG